MTNATHNCNKFALLIGINKYPKLESNYQLKGCVNDVEAMAHILQNNFGFPTSNITLLRDEQATYNGIKAALKMLVEHVSKNSIVVVHYSGHGSRVRDREGDEPDGWDETIVPYDSGREPDENHDITDDEIYEWLLDLSKKTPYVTLIFDCCFSGTITRDTFGPKARWVEPDGRPIHKLPPSPVAAKDLSKVSRDLGPSGWLPLSQRYLLIAGCRDEESSFEHWVKEGDRTIVHGALTYFLIQELVRAEPGTTHRDVFERSSIQVAAAHPHQHPQMEGARDRELFGVRDIKPMHFVSVKQRIGDKVTLDAGAAHGLTISSQWAIYPQGTKQVTEGTPRLGLVEISAVHAVESEARIIDENGSVIRQGNRAVEHAHYYGEMRLKVDIQAPDGYENAVAQLAKIIEESALLHRTEVGETADVRVYIVPPRTEVRENAPVPQIGMVTKPFWTVVEDGRVIMPICAVNETDAVIFLRDNLEKKVRYRQALALRNSNHNSLLKNKVEFILKRQESNNTWVKAETENAGGKVVFEQDERVILEIINHHSRPIYISILDFGLTGAISLLYPVQGASEQLIAGRAIEIGKRKGEEIELYLPDDFPYMPDPIDKMPDGGDETLKLFATTDPADFSILVQEGYRHFDLQTAKGASTPLWQLLTMALTGCGKREARVLSLTQDWTTVERSFFLKVRRSSSELTD